jgi:hypothetical protein
MDKSSAVLQKRRSDGEALRRFYAFDPSLCAPSPWGHHRE